MLSSRAPAQSGSAAAAVPPADFFTDPAGKFYYLMADGRLVTANPLGENTYSFYDSSLGVPDDIDVSNPFEIIVHYRDYGQLVLLDRTLSELGRLDLYAIDELRQGGAVARSFDNRIWVFDDWAYRLKLFDNAGRLLQQTNDLRLELRLAEPPAAILVDRTFVSLLFPDRDRLAVFRNTGRFLHWVDLPAAGYRSWQPPFLLGLPAEPAAPAWRWRPEAGRAQPYPLPPWATAARRPRLTPTHLLTLDTLTTGHAARYPLPQPGPVPQNN